MAIPFLQTLMVGSYVVRQRLTGRKRYPLVLMLEPLFRCNLACAGCGKIDYPENPEPAAVGRRVPRRGRRMRRAGGVDRRRRAPAAQGNAQIVDGIVARRKFVYLCTNALLMKKTLDCSSRARTSCGRCISTAIARCTTIRCARTASTNARSRPSGREGRGLPRQHQLHAVQRCRSGAGRAAFFDSCSGPGVDGITVSPGYALRTRADQAHFLNRAKTKELFRDIFRRGRRRPCVVVQPVEPVLDFLAGNQDYRCTPWATRRARCSAGSVRATCWARAMRGRSAS